MTCTPTPAVQSDHPNLSIISNWIFPLTSKCANTFWDLNLIAYPTKLKRRQSFHHKDILLHFFLAYLLLLLALVYPIAPSEGVSPFTGCVTVNDTRLLTTCAKVVEGRIQVSML
jgi:hypothetical protein